MIEKALHDHLTAQVELAEYLATYDGKPAIFNQEAPADTDHKWGRGSQYGRIVFVEDIQGDPERTLGGMLIVDIMCKENEQFPEDIEPILRQMIHGYFFSNGSFTVAAQFKNTNYFTQPTDHVIGCTVSFDLLGFPIITTSAPDVIERMNECTSKIDGIHVINYDSLPAPAWKPTAEETAVYWRIVNENPAGWIPDTFSTIWRTAAVRGHIFAVDMATATEVARNLTIRLYASKRLLRVGESPIMVNRRNTTDNGADPLRTGQVTVEATYGIVVYRQNGETLNHINIE